jgi:hypothetical protein
VKQAWQQPSIYTGATSSVNSQSLPKSRDLAEIRIEIGTALVA